MANGAFKAILFGEYIKIKTIESSVACWGAHSSGTRGVGAEGE